MNAVDKLIFNCLVQYGHVALPEVGVLEVTPAEGGGRRGDGRKRVAFVPATSESHIQITDIIAEQGNLTPEEAAKHYAAWLRTARNVDGNLLIDGVGFVTARGQVEMHADMDAALNGEEGEDAVPLVAAAAVAEEQGGRKRRCSCCWCWVLLALLLIGGLVWWLLCGCDGCRRTCDVDERVVPELEVVVPEVEAEPVVEAVVEPAPSESKRSEKIGRYNVTVGVFAQRGNAQWCTTKDPLGIGKENYIIVPFPSNMEAVVACSTDDWGEALRAWRKYKKIMPDVWVYHRY